VSSDLCMVPALVALAGSLPEVLLLLAVVPGLYGAVADDTTDELLVRKLDLYWSRAINDSRVVGIKPWHFNNDPPINGSSPSARWRNQYHLGAVSYPKLMARLTHYGTMIKAAGGPQAATVDMGSPWRVKKSI
jgi:hypothetical protein